MTYDAIVLDNDGVLTHLTRTDVVRAAVEAAFAEFDAEPTVEGVDGVIHGSLTQIRRVCDLHGIDPEAFWPRREAQAAEAQRLAIESGAKPLYDDVSALYDIADDDLDLGVVSNNQHATVRHVLDAFDLDGLFSVAYGREPTIEGFRRRKPEPYYLERAVDELGAERALYVGDSNVDVLAADRAGLDVAFIRRGHRAEYELVAEPTHEIETLSDLLPLVGREPLRQ
ncbi:HAD family hydrolase [Halegenticoccus tardaugens]|uniref:HAD family hydrolase n=1 Tax=Halegenticoccus tardaugens TaxID=2071624 RepID=UPI00100BD469|nr:HAD family hydrolase [Halegenticoccus tardaugens]